MANKHPSIKEMGKFASFMEEIEKTHEWDEKKKDFVKRARGRPKKAPTVVIRVPADKVAQIKSMLSGEEKSAQ